MEIRGATARITDLLPPMRETLVDTRFEDCGIVGPAVLGVGANTHLVDPKISHGGAGT